jgi:hypothetical protein
MPGGKHSLLHRVQLLTWRRVGLPHDLQPVTFIARHHMDMEVEHALPRRHPGRVHQIHPSRGQRSMQHPRHPADRPGHPRMLLLIQIPQTLSMASGDHQSMPDRGWREVKKRQGVTVLQQSMCRGNARHDVAEHTAIHVGSL